MYSKFEHLLQRDGVSAYYVSKNTGISQATLSDWKKGKSVPKLDKLKLIADLFNVPLEYFTAKDEVIVLTDEIYQIPVFESASAGFGAYASSAVIDHIPLNFKCKSEAEKTICVKITGDSMYPKIEEGDTVVVRKTDCVDSGDIAVVMIDDEAFIKKIEYKKDSVSLLSINPLYPPIKVKCDDTASVRIVGKVTKIIKEV